MKRSDTSGGEMARPRVLPRSMAVLPVSALVACLALGDVRPTGAEPPATPGPAWVAPSAALDLADLLASARRASREDGAAAAEPRLLEISRAGNLWKVRADGVRAVQSRASAASFDASPLGLPGLGPFLALDHEGREAAKRALARSIVTRLLETTADAHPAIRRAALLAAARRAEGPAERAAVSAALGAPPENAGPRADIARALSLALLSPGDPAPLAALAARWPDAPERAPGLFDDETERRFLTAVELSPAAVRLARARALGARAPERVSALLQRISPAEVDARDLAAAHLALGQTRDARRVLGSLNPADPRVNALLLTADLRALSMAGPAAKASGPRSRKGRKGRAVRPVAAPPAPVVDSDAAHRLLGRVAELLASEGGSKLSDDDRQRLLSEAVRAATRAGRFDDAASFVSLLVELEPPASLGADDLFAFGFGLYQSGAFAEAERQLTKQAAAYRDVAVRRRATYWAARARERKGDAASVASAHALLATLVTTGAPDLYAQWAARSLGVPVSTVGPLPGAHEGGLDLLPALGRPAPPSRELLALGLPDLAEDAAELEGSLDAVFAGATASERGDYRRASWLLKTRYPELGTAEEGTVPAAVRKLFYPRAHGDLVEGAAAEWGVPPSLLYGLIRQESLFQPQAKSRAGARGLMQVMPATGRFLARQAQLRGVPNLDDPRQNVALGTRYIAQMIATFGGDAGAALAAYNAGPGRVVRWRRERGHLPEDEFFESLPLSEPRLYVKRVLFYQAAYATLYGGAGAPVLPPAVGSLR